MYHFMSIKTTTTTTTICQTLAMSKATNDATTNGAI